MFATADFKFVVDIQLDQQRNLSWFPLIFCNTCNVDGSSFDGYCWRLIISQFAEKVIVWMVVQEFVDFATILFEDVIEIDMAFGGVFWIIFFQCVVDECCLSSHVEEYEVQHWFLHKNISRTLNRHPKPPRHFLVIDFCYESIMP